MDDCVATIGFFDGVHRGHQFVIGSVVAEARQRGMQAVVVTLHPPRTLLTTLEDKRRLIIEAGADRCEVLSFDKELMSLTARTFMEKVLREQLHVRVLMLGYDNRFGRRTEGIKEGFDDYVLYGRELGIEVVRMPEYHLETGENGAVPHSSAIREALLEGRVADAAALLGRPYTLTGQVVHGFGEGHRLGFPTANLTLKEPQQLIPDVGVYAVEVTGEGIARSVGMMNIGTRPTYNGHERTLEVHILDYDGDLYDKTLTVGFLQRIRSERLFASPKELRKQLMEDRGKVRNLKR